MQSVTEEQEEKTLQLLGGIILKLQVFYEKTRNPYKELKDGIPSAVDAFKKVKATRGRRLATQAPKDCLSVTVQVVIMSVTVAVLPAC